MQYIFTIIFVLFSYMVFCQEPVFVVLNMKGKVQIDDGNQKQAAKIGLKLNGNEHIIVADKSEATLACKSDGYVTLNKPGDYNLADYKDKCQAPKSNILVSYFKFAWEEFAKTETSNTPDNQDKMDNVGAAVRGSNKCYVTIDSSMQTINYFEGVFPLSWKNNVQTSLRLKVFEYPDGGTPIIDIPVTGNVYDLSKLVRTLKKGSDYFWTLIPKNDELCNRNHLEIWEKADYELLIKAFKNEVSNVTTDNAGQAYMMGYLLENMHFLAESWKYYNNAAKLAPGNAQYDQRVKYFKKKYGLH